MEQNTHWHELLVAGLCQPTDLQHIFQRKTFDNTSDITWQISSYAVRYITLLEEHIHIAWKATTAKTVYICSSEHHMGHSHHGFFSSNVPTVSTDSVSFLRALKLYVEFSHAIGNKWRPIQYNGSGDISPHLEYPISSIHSKMICFSLFMCL